VRRPWLLHIVATACHVKVLRSMPVCLEHTCTHALAPSLIPVLQLKFPKLPVSIPCAARTARAIPCAIQLPTLLPKPYVAPAQPLLLASSPPPTPDCRLSGPGFPQPVPLCTTCCPFLLCLPCLPCFAPAVHSRCCPTPNLPVALGLLLFPAPHCPTSQNHAALPPLTHSPQPARPSTRS